MFNNVKLYQTIKKFRIMILQWLRRLSTNFDVWDSIPESILIGSCICHLEVDLACKNYIMDNNLNFIMDRYINCPIDPNGGSTGTEGLNLSNSRKYIIVKTK